MKYLYILANERIYYDKRNFFCENKDIQSIVNYFSHKYKLIVISRYSNSIKPFILKKNYKVFNLRLIYFFNFLKFILSDIKKKKF